MYLKKIRYIKKDLYHIIGILCLFFSAFASLYSPLTNAIGLYVAIPIACLLATKFNKGFHTSIYEKILYTLFLWDCISYFWAEHKELASTELHMVLGTFLLVYCLSIYARNFKLIPYLYFIYVLLYLSAWNYAIHNIFTMMVDDSDRLNDEVLNANTMAYYTFYVSFLFYILSEIVNIKWLKKIWEWCFWLMLPASFGISILTSSRQVPIIQVPLYAMLIYIKYVQGASLKNKLKLGLFALLIAVVFSGYIISAYNNSFLKERAEINIADDGRAALARNAIQVGFNNLPLGIGAGNFQGVSITRQISHNSYLEAFVNMGIPGLALYLALLGMFVHRQWKRYWYYKDKMFLAFFTFGVLYILDGFFFVFYNSLWLISFFMLVATHSETYYKKHNTELKKENKEIVKNNFIKQKDASIQ